MSSCLNKQIYLTFTDSIYYCHDMRKFIVINVLVIIKLPWPWELNYDKNTNNMLSS